MKFSSRRGCPAGGVFVDLLEVMGFDRGGISLLAAWQISNGRAEGKRRPFAGDRMENGSV